ncbi:hypothetical protein [Oricola indica]|nr:hypothetical protein [Oricola indica]
MAEKFAPANAPIRRPKTTPRGQKPCFPRVLSVTVKKMKKMKEVD